MGRSRIHDGSAFLGAYRVQLLGSIQIDVESVLPSSFASLSTMRDYLSLAGQTAAILATMGRYPYRLPRLDEALDDERDCYISFINQITSTDLSRIEPLPFCFRFSADESKRTWDVVDYRWGTENGRCWYPLTSLKSVSSDILALQAAWFRAEVPDDTVRRILAQRGIERVWELHEWGWVYQIDLSLLTPAYGDFRVETDEQYWTTEEMDWLIYASHESSITLAGAWLIETIKEIWPGWQEHLYTGWEYERPSINAQSPFYDGWISTHSDASMSLAAVGQSAIMAVATD